MLKQNINVQLTVWLPTYFSVVLFTRNDQAHQVPQNQSLPGSMERLDTASGHCMTYRPMC